MPRPEPLATTEEVAAYLRREPRTLEGWRSKRRGPRWLVLCGQVRYRWDEVQRWVAAREGPETSDRPASKLRT